MPNHFYFYCQVNLYKCYFNIQSNGLNDSRAKFFTMALGNFNL